MGMKNEMTARDHIALTIPEIIKVANLLLLKNVNSNQYTMEDAAWFEMLLIKMKKRYEYMV